MNVMKKTTVLSILFLLIFLLLVMIGCNQMGMSHLKGNYHMKKANQLYKEEKFRAAVKEYELALETAPELKIIYPYLGTAYSMLYRPAKSNPQNDNYAEKAVMYLLNAREENREDTQIIMALADIYEKTENTVGAEKCYLELLEHTNNDPNAYYKLADFYSKQRKFHQAEAIYLQCIDADPLSPSGYHHYTGFLQQQRQWKKAVLNHEKRLYAMLDTSIISTMREYEALEKDAQDTRHEIEKNEKYIKNVKKNGHISLTEKRNLLKEANEKTNQLKRSLERSDQQITQLKDQTGEEIRGAESTINSLPAEKKQKIAEVFYTIGNVCWNWSYQTPPTHISNQERAKVIEKGLLNLEKAEKCAPTYAQLYLYIGLLHREKIKIDSLGKNKYIELSEKYNKKFREVHNRNLKRELYKKQLEEMDS